MSHKFYGYTWNVIKVNLLLNFSDRYVKTDKFFVIDNCENQVI